MKWINLVFITLVFLLSASSCTYRGNNPLTDRPQRKSIRELSFNEARELIKKMGDLSDQRQWFDLEQVFASRVVLNFGTPELLTPTQIVDRWKPVLTYFDKTNHEITNFQLHETQGRLLGSANFSVFYKKGTDVTLRGQYEFEFFRDSDNKLKIMRLNMIPGSALGNERLLVRARNISVTDPVNYRVEVVSFQSKGNKIVGWLLKPKNPSSRDVVIIAGPWGSVKEQIAFPYAQDIVKKGFPVLVFDFAGLGESQGKIRNLEDPSQKMENFTAAIDYITARPEYEKSKINLIGMAASAGYVTHKTASDPRISRMILIAPWLYDKEIIKKYLSQTPGYNRRGYKGRISAGERASKKYYGQEIVDYIPIASFTNQEAVLYAEDGYNLDYFLNPSRGNLPQWSNRFATMSWKPILTFNAMEAAPLIKVPTLIIYSEESAIPDGVKKFASLMKIKPQIKEITGSQFEFYDQPYQVARAVNSTIEFLNQEIPMKAKPQAQEEPVTPRTKRY